MPESPRRIAESLKGHRVRLTLHSGLIREGTMGGCGEFGFTLHEGNFGKTHWYYGEATNIEDLGEGS